jgi:hypothetical protein
MKSSPNQVSNDLAPVAASLLGVDRNGSAARGAATPGMASDRNSGCPEEQGLESEIFRFEDAGASGILKLETET